MSEKCSDREQDDFEAAADPYDETVIEEDLPDETDAERNICLECGNILQSMRGWRGWFCPVCEHPHVKVI